MARGERGDVGGAGGLLVCDAGQVAEEKGERPANSASDRQGRRFTYRRRTGYLSFTFTLLRGNRSERYHLSTHSQSHFPHFARSVKVRRTPRVPLSARRQPAWPAPAPAPAPRRGRCPTSSRSSTRALRWTREPWPRC
jgi:hypothetical protein